MKTIYTKIKEDEVLYERLKDKLVDGDEFTKYLEPIIHKSIKKV